MWKGLVQHARQWGEGKHPTLARQVLELFQQRFEKHCDFQRGARNAPPVTGPIMAAAYVVDPAHFTFQQVGGMTTMQLPDLTDREREGVMAVVQRLSGGSAGAVEDELINMQMSNWPASMLQAGKIVLGAGGQPAGLRGAAPTTSSETGCRRKRLSR
jgi:hypothetical protein